MPKILPTGPFHKVCDVCGIKFTASTGRPHRCPECQEYFARKAKNERDRLRKRIWRMKNPLPETIICADCGQSVPYSRNKKRCEECQAERKARLQHERYMNLKK